MLTHPYWGTVTEDWSGLAAEQPITLPFFEKEISVFLGEELFEEEEEYNLTPAQLDEYADTMRAFLDQTPILVAEIKQKTFEYYLQLYAHHYEDPTQSGAPALGLTTAEQHFPYLQNVAYLRVTDGHTLRLSIHYGLDSEHGLEILFVDNALVAIGGIADT